jgi:hypothetical protein
MLELGSGFILVLAQAVNGILIGLVFRFSLGGNITKIFADAGALLLTLFLAAVLLRQFPTLDMICGNKQNKTKQNEFYLNLVN